MVQLAPWHLRHTTDWLPPTDTHAQRTTGTCSLSPINCIVNQLRPRRLCAHYAPPLYSYFNCRRLRSNKRRLFERKKNRVTAIATMEECIGLHCANRYRSIFVTLTHDFWPWSLSISRYGSTSLRHRGLLRISYPLIILPWVYDASFNHLNNTNSGAAHMPCRLSCFKCAI